MRTLLSLCALSLFCSASFADIVINEIHYNPDQGDDELYEFIELYNTANTAVDLGGAYLNDAVEGTIPDSTMISAHGYLVLAQTAVEVESYYGITGVIQWDDGAINNSGETIELYSSDDILLDSVTYDDGNDWPSAADGDGPSCELVNPLFDNNVGTNWAASTQIDGTPGAQNSTYIAIGPEIAFSNVYHDPQQPSSGEGVDVYCTVLTSSPVDSVVLAYNITPGVYAYDSLAMVPQVNFAWMTTIPGQPGGTEVQYTLTAYSGNSCYGAFGYGYMVCDAAEEIVINELHFNPAGEQGDDDDYEFLELYNPNAYTVSLAGWEITQGIDYVFADTCSIAAGEYLVLAKNATTFASWYGFTPLQWFSGNLGNSGETVELQNACGVQIDLVAYDDGWGGGAADGDGASLELNDPALDNDDGDNWHASYILCGTPGAPNSTEQTADAQEESLSFQLAQNYPNPFNPSTTIAFSLSQTAEVKLSVFDLSGREVAVLVNGLLEAGQNELSFDASALASGIYLYRLQADGLSQTRRMVLLK